MALAISQAENGTRECKRIHVNSDGSKDVGVFQLNSIHANKGNIFDCTENIKIAYQIFKRQGWTPWTVYKSGIYKKYLTLN